MEKEQWKSFDFDQNLAILGNYNYHIVLIFLTPGSVFAYDHEDCYDHQFLLLKHHNHCLVTVSCK